MAAAQPLRFAPLPLEDPKIIHEQIGGLIDFLTEQAEVSIQWTHFRDYGDLLTAFHEGEIDLAYLGPLPLAILQRDHSHAQPLGCFREADGAPHYTCSLVAYADDSLFPSEIQGKRIGLTQPYSTCGWLAVSEMLRAAGRRLDGDTNQFTYAGNHAKAALGVVRGRFDVAGVKTAIAQRYAHLNLEPIAESQHWPGFSLVANTATLSAAMVARLQQVLASLEDLEHKPALAQLTAAWGPQIRHGIVAPRECDYAAVTDALSYLPWPIPGAPITGAPIPDAPISGAPLPETPMTPEKRITSLQQASGRPAEVVAPMPPRAEAQSQAIQRP